MSNQNSPIGTPLPTGQHTAGAVQEQAYCSTGSGEREEDFMKNLKYEDLVMTNEEIGKVVDSHMDSMTSDEIMDIILYICEKSIEKEPEALKNADSVTKIMYIANEMYKCGFANALYLANESVKEAIKKYGENVA